jgi:carboxyl-terminal processing protease
MERAIHGEFQKEDSIKFSGKQKYKTLAGRTVYGGGGIMPDYFVPADTSGYSEYYSKVTQKGLVYQFALAYADSQRKELSAYKTSADFEMYFSKVNVLNLFVAFAETKGIKTNPADLKVSSKVIDNQVKAYIARNIIGEKGFYPIIQNIDKTLLQAIEKVKIPIQQNLTSSVTK